MLERNFVQDDESQRDYNDSMSDMTITPRDPNNYESASDLDEDEPTESLADYTMPVVKSDSVEDIVSITTVEHSTSSITDSTNSIENDEDLPKPIPSLTFSEEIPQIVASPSIEITDEEKLKRKNF